MLVLSRKVGEQIIVPGLGLTITVVRVQGGLVRLGFDAPADVAVWRAELDGATSRLEKAHRPTQPR
jgi:carbon storage regulator